MELTQRVGFDDTDDQTASAGLTFSFVIDGKGRILSLESAATLRGIGWDERLVGRSCYTAIACRDFGGAALCQTCAVARGSKAGALWARPIARMRAKAGEVVARSSRVRRLLRNQLRIETTV